MKPNLFFDLDDTLINTDELLRVWVAFAFGIELPAGYINGNSLPTLVNSLLPSEDRIDSNTFYRRMNDDFLHHRYWRDRVEPMPGAVKAVDCLSNIYNIWVITARPNTSLNTAWNIFGRLFGNKISGVSFVWRLNQKGEYEKVQDKDEIIIRFSMKQNVGFVDDNPDEVRKAGRVLPAILFDPHGHHINEDLGAHKRVTSWDEVVEIFLP